MADEKIPGNVFWIYFTLLSIIGLTYLAIWSFHNENLKGLAIALIFSVMLIFSSVLSRGEIFRLKGGFRKNAFFFVLAFVIWGSVVAFKKIQLQAGQTFSLLSTVTPARNVLFAEISNELPKFWQFYIDQINNPFIEECFFLIGIPFGIIWILKLLSEEKEGLEWLAHPITETLIILVVAAATFAVFHVGSFILVFVISAVLFRTIIIIIYWGDELMDILPNYTVIASAGVGMHMANNWLDFGFFKGIEVLASSPFGIIVLVSLGLIVIAAIDFVIETPLKLLFADK